MSITSEEIERLVQKEIDELYSFEEDQRPRCSKEEYAKRMRDEFNAQPSWDLNRVTRVVWYEVHRTDEKENPFR